MLFQRTLPVKVIYHIADDKHIPLPMFEGYSEKKETATQLTPDADSNSVKASVRLMSCVDIIVRLSPELVRDPTDYALYHAFRKTEAAPCVLRGKGFLTILLEAQPQCFVQGKIVKEEMEQGLVEDVVECEFYLVEAKRPPKEPTNTTHTSSPTLLITAGSQSSSIQNESNPNPDNPTKMPSNSLPTLPEFGTSPSMIPTIPMAQSTGPPISPNDPQSYYFTSPPLQQQPAFQIPVIQPKPTSGICRNVFEWFNKVTECEQNFIRYCRTNHIPVSLTADYGGQQEHFANFLQQQGWTFSQYIQAKRASRATAELKAGVPLLREVWENPKSYTPLHLLKILAKYNRPIL